MTNNIYWLLVYSKDYTDVRFKEVSDTIGYLEAFDADVYLTFYGDRDTEESLKNAILKMRSDYSLRSDKLRIHLIHFRYANGDVQYYKPQVLDELLLDLVPDEVLGSHIVLGTPAFGLAGTPGDRHAPGYSCILKVRRMSSNMFNLVHYTSPLPPFVHHLTLRDYMIFTSMVT